MQNQLQKLDTPQKLSNTLDVLDDSTELSTPTTVGKTQAPKEEISFDGLKIPCSQEKPQIMDQLPKQQGHGIIDSSQEEIEDSQDQQEDKTKTVQTVQEVSSFDDLKLSKEVLMGIYAYGYQNPTYIQKMGIRPILQGKDLIAQAQSGSGKTATFGIGILANIDVKAKGVQAIVISPNGQLAFQTFRVIRDLGKEMKVRVHCSKGGVSYQFERKNLKKAQIVVGTPGRLLDLMNKDYLKMDNLKMLVIDEIDQIIGKAYEQTIDEIYQHLKKDVQICVFSATLPPKQLEVCRELVSEDHEEILVDIKDVIVKNVKQYNIHCEKKEWKMEVITEFLDHLDSKKTMIFANHKTTVVEMAENLKYNGQKVSYVCGGMDRRSQNQNMKDFRLAKTNILICTNQLARGIDFQGVELVINYDLPFKVPEYIHRIGRAGRGGNTGKAVNFITKEDQETIDFIQKIFGIDIEECPENLDGF